MSAILDALKRVEEQLRANAGQKASENQPGAVDPSKARDDSQAQSKESGAKDSDEATRIYLSLVEMISSIQDTVRKAADHEREETRKAVADVAEAAESLRKDLTRAKSDLEEETRRNASERESQIGVLEQVRAEIDSLKRGLSDSGRSGAESSDSLTALQNEVAAQRQALQEEILQRNAQRESAKLELAATQSQIEPLRQMLAQAKSANDETVIAVKKMAEDVVRLQDGLKKDATRRDAALEEQKAELLAVQSQLVSMAGANAATGQSIADLSSTIALTRSELDARMNTLEMKSERRHAELRAKEPAPKDSAAESIPVVQLPAEIAETIAGLTQQLVDLKAESAAKREEILNWIRKHDAAQDVLNDASERLQSELDPLRTNIRENADSIAKLAQITAQTQADLANQSRVFEEELREQAAERTAEKAAVAAMQSQLEPLRQALAGNTEAVAKLAQTMTQLQSDFARHGQAVEQALRGQTAERTAEKAVMEQMQSRLELLRQARIESKDETAKLTDAVAALADDLGRQKEALAEEINRWRLQREADKAVEVDLQLLSVDARPATSRVEDMPERPPADAPETKHAIDKHEAQRLHSAAGEAYARRDYAEALRYLDTINAAFPGNKSILYNRAECLMNLGRKKEASDLCDYLILVLEHAPAEELKKKIAN